MLGHSSEESATLTVQMELSGHIQKTLSNLKSKAPLTYLPLKHLCLGNIPPLSDDYSSFT